MTAKPTTPSPPAATSNPPAQGLLANWNPDETPPIKPTPYREFRDWLTNHGHLEWPKNDRIAAKAEEIYSAELAGLRAENERLKLIVRERTHRERGCLCELCIEDESQVAEVVAKLRAENERLQTELANERASRGKLLATAAVVAMQLSALKDPDMPEGLAAAVGYMIDHSNEGWQLLAEARRERDRLKRELDEILSHVEADDPREAGRQLLSSLRTRAEQAEAALAEVRQAAAFLCNALGACTILKGESATMDVERQLFHMRELLATQVAGGMLGVSSPSPPAATPGPPAPGFPVEPLALGSADKAFIAAERAIEPLPSLLVPDPPAPDLEPLANLIAQGWTPATTLPNNDRTVQVAWDDGSYGANSLAFCDSKSGDPSGERLWWSSAGCGVLPPGTVIAWREKPAPSVPAPLPINRITSVVPPMLEIIDNPNSTEVERSRAASTIVEAIAPDILEAAVRGYSQQFVREVAARGGE